MDTFSSALTCRNFIIESAAGIVRCSSIVQKSVSYLDLSTLEFTFHKRYVNCSSRISLNFLKVFFNNEDAVKKYLVEDRKLLSSLNLNIPKGREPRLHNVKEFEFAGFLADSRSLHVGTIFVSDDWFSEKLKGFILKSVKRSKQKLQTLSNVLRSHEKTYNFWGTSLYVVRYDLGIICFELNQSCSTKGLIISFNTAEISRNINRPELSEIHAYGCFEGNGNLDNELFILHEFIMDGVLEFVPTLIQHGFAVKFNEKGYKQLQESLIWSELLEDELEFIAEGKMSTRRSFLLMQVLHIVSYIISYPALANDALEALKMIWRSIPDAVLSQNEIQRVYDGMLEKEHFEILNTVYEQSVEEFPVNMQPRTLKHLSRVSVRNSISTLQKFSDVLGGFGFPPTVLSYVKLKE